MDNAKDLALQGIAEGFKAAVAKSFENLAINASAQPRPIAISDFAKGVERMLILADEALKAIDQTPKW